MTTQASGGGFSEGETARAKKAFWIFLTVAVVCVAQVSWWLVYQVRQAGRLAELEHHELDLRAYRLADSLNLEYSKLWHSFNDITSDSNWSGSVPRALVDHPLLRSINRREGVAYSQQSSFGQYRRDNWTWVFPGPHDTLWITLDPVKTAAFVERLDPNFEFRGAQPMPGDQPWSFDPLPVRPKVSLMESVDGRRHRAVTMFASEGSFFLLLTVVGVYLIYRTVSKSAELGRRQHNFVSAVTHELKAPLASVKLYAETLQRPEISAGQQQEFLGRMLEDVARLEHTIDNTLMAGRLEERGFHLDLKPADLSQAVSEYQRGLASYLERHRFQLESRLEPGIHAIIDYDAMRRVVESLIDNAVKYSGNAGRGELTLNRKGDHVVLTVVDFGSGIPAEEIDKVFGAFYRVGNEMTRQIKGTGLGLYLVREIVAAHGGDVKIASAGPNLGTTVTVELRASA